VVRYWELLNQGWDAVFASRFVKGGGEIDYPWLKLRLNRLANAFIMLMFGIKLNDTTNVCKAICGWRSISAAVITENSG
jgi:dolichol-phosphate mannosyltransferase